ncbi:carboxypeptidase-like regulatory domain-containing protein [Lacihabitans lacunae]|uniref:Carboxypeptidase-like regulatory domain-containing protein n=1 Tax=Lacihabitans lacunae TaxID=1028214 RepID=A0ABV7Z2D4_9BACT
MTKNYFFPKKNLLGLIFLLVLPFLASAQTVITGVITDSETKEPLVGISVQVKGKVIGTITDIKGKFEFSTTTPLPIPLVISSVGYQTQEYTVNSENATINISLVSQDIYGQEVVVSASRVEESIMKAPVTVEKMDIRDIKQTASASFYDGLANIKGVDMTTQGLLFKSINMRGFGATGNPRTVQMIDGMDNQAPGLNFPIDNIVGIPELDVESVEILPGAASALYGPNGINGLILMNSKSPFLYQGLSANIKSGIMSASNRDVKTTPFYDLSVRYAKAINNKFAYKVNVAYIGAQDWQASSNTNLNVGGVENGLRGAGVDNDYDGVNTYGDEVQSTLGAVANGILANPAATAAQKAGIQGALNAGLIPVNEIVSRTGFAERDLVDYNTKSLKANAALHYRVNEKVELVGQVNYGYGTTVYTGTGRYSLRNFNLTQGKLELRGDNFTLRTYTTQERSGQSYVAGLAAVGMLNEVKPHALWFADYLGTYVGEKLAGQSNDAAFLTARAKADDNLPKPGTDAYNTLFTKYRETNIANNGSAFLDRTNLYHAEGIYNFKNQIKFMDLMVGLNHRVYSLRSGGTLFSDNKPDENGNARNGVININETGGFIQAGKSLFNDHLKLTASLRGDKNQNFDLQLAPRVSSVFSFGQNNIRLSYLSGYRIPTTQNQYIDLKTPQGVLIGALPEFDSRYNLASGVSLQVLTDFAKNGLNSQFLSSEAKSRAIASATAYATAAVTPAIPQIQAGVIAAAQASVTAAVTAAITAQVQAGTIPASQAPALIAAEVTKQLGALVTAEVTKQVTAVANQVAPAYLAKELPKYQKKDLVPERISSYEIGYKGLIAKKLFVDAYYYTSTYKNFIGGVSVIVPTAAAGPGLPIESGVASASTRVGYSRVANTSETIKVDGWATSLNYAIKNGYNVSFNIANNNLKNFTPSPEQQYAGFNTAKYRYNLGFGKTIGSGDKVGFNVSFKHQDAFLWESSFMVPTTTSVNQFSNTTVPAINNIDAQVSFKVPTIKSVIKVGGSNIGGKPYVQAFGSASVGSMYYVSLSFDELLNK